MIWLESLIILACIMIGARKTALPWVLPVVWACACLFLFSDYDRVRLRSMCCSLSRLFPLWRLRCSVQAVLIF